ncbi:MAG: arabinan endo-1,5-alpha-L-arabinosidase, partial [Armatimonadota bacterium]
GHNSIWAPAPVVIGDTLRLYYCASARFGQNTSFIGMAECKHFNPSKPTEGWVDKGLLVSSKQGVSNFNAIDPDVCIGPDGRQWMVYGSYWSGIYEVELDAASGLVKDPAKPALHVASNTADKGNPLEAPALVYHDGQYYLFVTYGLAAQGIRSTYRMMCGRSKNPDGPFLGFDDKTSMAEGGNTVLLRSSSPMFGPGGGNFFLDEHGNSLMAYHYYDSRRFWNRDIWGAPTMQSRHMVWGPDGWPVPGLPVGVNLSHGVVDGEWMFQVDFGRVDTLTLTKEGVCKLGNQAGKWVREGKKLTFHWPRLDGAEGEYVDTLTLDESDQFFVGRNQFGAVIRGIKRNAETAS